MKLRLSSIKLDQIVQNIGLNFLILSMIHFP